MRREEASSAGPRLGLSWMDAPDWCAAASPLFEAGRVDVLEWTFDAQAAAAPRAGARELLSFFAGRGALLGHGVSYSVLGAGGEARRRAWLEGFASACERYPLHWVTEHFGCMGAEGLRFASPLPMPMTSAALRLGQRRLRALAEVFDGPLGLENLAFAFTRSDVLQEGEFLRELLGAVDGFVLLDLHNLYCRAHNFGIPADELLERYPLERVRELHISGGSWVASRAEPGEEIRRDTHDQAVPEAVFELLERALPRCPSLEFVLLERLGGSLPSARDAAAFRADYERLETLTAGARRAS